MLGDWLGFNHLVPHAKSAFVYPLALLRPKCDGLPKTHWGIYPASVAVNRHWAKMAVHLKPKDSALSANLMDPSTDCQDCALHEYVAHFLFLRSTRRPALKITLMSRVKIMMLLRDLISFMNACE